MDLRTPLLVVSLLSCVGLGAWGMGLQGEVASLQDQVDKLEARQEAAAKARSERRAELRQARSRGGVQARSGRASSGGPGGMGVLDDGGARRRSADSGGDRGELLQIAEDNVRAEIAAERRAHFAERAEAMDAALQDYLAEAGYADEVAAEITALLDANREAFGELLTRAEAGEIERSTMREEMHTLRQDTSTALVELLGEEEAAALSEAVFYSGRGGPGSRATKE